MSYMLLFANQWAGIGTNHCVLWGHWLESAAWPACSMHALEMSTSYPAAQLKALLKCGCVSECAVSCQYGNVTSCMHETMRASGRPGNRVYTRHVKHTAYDICKTAMHMLTPSRSLAQALQGGVTRRLSKPWLSLS
jgi:hypothetical protein